MSLLNLALVIQSKFLKLQHEYAYETLKKIATTLTNLQILSKNFTDNNETFISGDSMFSSQMYISGNNNTLNEDIAVRNNFPIFNLKECEKQLKQYNNISSNDSIIYAISSMKGLLNNATTQPTYYTLSAYNPVTKEMLNLDICMNTTQTIQLPISNATNLNLTLYKDLKAKGIDIYDPNNTYFNNRCASYIDTNSSKDTTVNWRRQNYLQSIIPQCLGLNCTYSGINEKNYIKCICGIKTGVEFVDNQVNYALSLVNQFNLDVAVCVNTLSVNKI
jgi:hypothetical protein